MTDPLVSVVMPIYNAGEFLSDAIDSILSQSHERLELIAVDDGSTDGSAAVVEKAAMRDRRVIPIHLEHGRTGRAANAGIRAASGDWIARADADDISLPFRIEAQLAWVREQRVEITGGLVETFGSKKERWWFPRSAEASRRELLFRPCLMQPTLFLRAGIAKANPYDENARFEDYELLTRLALEHDIGSLPQVVTRYRVHPSQNTAVMQSQVMADFRAYRLRYFYELFPGTPLADYLALARVSDRQPFRSHEEMDRAGRWLADLANLPDPDLKAAMARRWREARERSPDLDATKATACSAATCR